MFQQGGPVVMKEVDEQTFDMGTILILRQNKHFRTIQQADWPLLIPRLWECVYEAGYLISHDHDLAIAQAP